MAEIRSKNLMAGFEEIENSRQKAVKTSFITGLFNGEPNFNLIAPFPEQSPEDKKIGDKFCAKVEEFLRTYVDPDEIEQTAKIPEEILKEAFELGLFGMKVPEKYGGLGFTQTNYGRVLTLIASWCNVFALTLSAHQSIGVPQMLLEFGNKEQKEKYLPLVARWQISGFALTEPRVGSDAASMEAEAVLNREGTDFIINGEKLWCTNGPVAEVIVLMARVPAKKLRNESGAPLKDAMGNQLYMPCPEGNGSEMSPITSFIVEMKTPGIEIVKCRFEGCRGIENAYLRFKNARIPIENVIGEVGNGLRYALTLLNTGRISINAIALGMAKQTWQPTINWANFRKTFGKKLGQHELPACRIAGMAANIFAMDAVTWLASQMDDRKKTDIRVEAALSKVFCSESAIQVIRDAQVIMGGCGYETADSKRFRGEIAFPMEQLVRDIEMYRIGEGSTDILDLFCVREALDIHIKIAEEFLSAASSKKIVRFLKLANFYAKWHIALFSPKSLPKSVAHRKFVKNRLRYVKILSRLLGFFIFLTLTKNFALVLCRKATAQELRDRQSVMARIANIAKNLFIIAATALYAEYQERGHGRPEAWDLADHFFRAAKKRLYGNGYFGNILKNDDQKDAAVGRKALQGIYYWLSEGAIIRKY